MSGTSEGSAFIAGAFLGVGLAVIVSMIVMGEVRDSFREEAIQKGFAEFNSQTGEWQWKEQKQ